MRRLPLLLCAALLLCGCNIYSSGVALDEPAAASFDDALLGTWVVLDDDTTATEAPVLEVRRFNEREYLLEWSERVLVEVTGGEATESYQQRARAFVTVIDGVPIVNIEDLDERTFSFARYAVTGSELRFRMIAAGANERGLTGTYESSEALRAAVHARVLDPLLYEEDETVARRIPRMARP